MSDFRLPLASFSRRTAEYCGKKTGKSCKIEIFSATDFARSWAPPGKSFSPRPPLRDSDRIIFWRSRYRVRLDGKWLIEGARYTLFTRDEIVERFLNFNFKTENEGC